MNESDISDVDKLKYHLDILLDEEIDSLEESSSVIKLDRIFELISECHDKEDAEDIQEFADRFNSKNHSNLKAVYHRKKPVVLLKLNKWVACFGIIIFIFFTTEFVAVQAFEFSFIKFIRLTASQLIFQLDTAENRETVTIDKYKDYYDLSNELNINFFIPDGEIAESFYLENLEYNEFGDSITAAYSKKDSYFIWEIFLPNGQGTLDYFTDEPQLLEDNILVGDKKVSIYGSKTDEGVTYTITFIYDDILYLLESDLSQEDILSLVKEAKKVNEK